jgi:hypothetical protein
MSQVKISGPRVMQAAGIAVFVLTLVIAAAMARGAPAADAGLEDEARAQVDAGPPLNDGLGTSPSWVDIVIVVAPALWSLVSGIVYATPTKRDDRFMARLAQRLSFLRPPNTPRGWLGPLSMPGTRPKRVDWL